MPFIRQGRPFEFTNTVTHISFQSGVEPEEDWIDDAENELMAEN